MTRGRVFVAMVWALVAWLPCSTGAAETWLEGLEAVEVGPVDLEQPLALPVGTHGVELTFLYANGGAETAPESIAAKRGLRLRLTGADRYEQRVRAYLTGQTPFLVTHMRTLAAASEVLGRDPATRPVVIGLLGWDTGARLVVRGDVTSVNDLKGRRVVLRRHDAGPLLLDAILRSARLTWTDVHVIWAEDRARSPAELFGADEQIAAALLPRSEARALTAGAARVLVSGEDLSRANAWVLVCRQDFFTAHRQQAIDLVAAYLKAAEELAALRRRVARGQDLEATVGTSALTGGGALDRETTAAMLQRLSDCEHAGYVGNIRFFADSMLPTAFGPMNARALQLAEYHRLVADPGPITAAKLDYQTADFLGYLRDTEIDQSETFDAEALQEQFNTMTRKELDDATIASFSIAFEPNQAEFDAEQYAESFREVADAAASFPGSVIVIRGHSDPTRVLATLVRAGLAKGTLTRDEQGYLLAGQPLTDPHILAEAIADGRFGGVPQHSARQVYQATLNISLRRAMAVRAAILDYAREHGYQLDPGQLQPLGVGVREPLRVVPADLGEARENMRVEFRIVKARKGNK